MESNRIRQSNFELLRILAIMGVLAGHGVAMVNNLPTRSDIQTDTFSSVFYVIFSALFVGSVDVFVLISGWFGIRASIKGLLKLLFQFFFLIWCVTAIFLLTGEVKVNQLIITKIMGLTDGYWFVMAYIGLYILSPILNVYVENANKRQQEVLLLSFYVFQCYYSWVTSYVNYFNGYSIVLFIGLYLTSRYFKKFPIRVITNHPWRLFFILIAGVSFVLLSSLYFFGNASRMLRYDNPIVIMACMCIIIGIQRWKFYSKTVNWLAASCFAVYVLHFHPFVFIHFLRYARLIYHSYSGLGYVCVIFISLAAVYFICTLIDQIRLFFWKYIEQRLKGSV